jgi:hypothetical protein
MCSYNVLGGKFDLEKINKIYLFDKNYLIKMKYDLNFLKNSRITTLYGIEWEESDPFLIFINFKNPELENIHNIRVSEQMLHSIKQGQFLILQDLIFYHIHNINKKKTFKNNSNNTARSVSPKNYNKSPNLDNSNLKRAVDNIIKLYSPQINSAAKKPVRPHSSKLMRKSNYY